MVNKKIGNEYERKLLKKLQEKGYWCHLFATNTNGQPCDVIALKNDAGILIDVKHCSGDRFDFKNIQPNQFGCFEYAKSCGNHCCGFAIWFEEQQNWFWLPYRLVKELQKDNIKSIRYTGLRLFFEE